MSPHPNQKPRSKGKMFLIEAALAPEELGWGVLWSGVECREVRWGIPVEIRWREVWGGVGEPLCRVEDFLQGCGCCLKKHL